MNNKISCGAQLFTFRKVATSKEVLPELFRRIAEMGCTCAQVSGICEYDAKELRKIADDNGIKIPLTHSPFERITADLDALAEEHLILGAESVGLGMLPFKYMSGESKLMEFIDIMNATAEKLKAYNLGFGYHNHFFEFKKLRGKTKYDIMIEQTQDVQFILDTYWVKFSGYDPVEYLKKLNGRAATIHLKDYKKGIVGAKIMDVGSGTLDFPAILKAAEDIGTRYAVIEHDTTKDAYATTQNGMDYLKKIYLNPSEH